MKNVLTICDILLLQEHWYFEQYIKLLETVLGIVQVYRVYGRPFDGCAVALMNSLKCNFTPFHINNR